MTTHPRDGQPPDDPQDRLSHEEFQRLVSEAQMRGEPTAPLIKRLVLQTIDEVQEQIVEELSSQIVN